MTDCDGKHYWLINSAGTHGECKFCGAVKDFPPPRWTDSMIPSYRREIESIPEIA